MSSGPSIPRARKKKRPIELTLSDGARARLDTLAEERGMSRSAVVEELVYAALFTARA